MRSASAPAPPRPRLRAAFPRSPHLAAVHQVAPLVFEVHLQGRGQSGCAGFEVGVQRLDSWAAAARGLREVWRAGKHWVSGPACCGQLQGEGGAPRPCRSAERRAPPSCRRAWVRLVASKVARPASWICAQLPTPCCQGRGGERRRVTLRRGGRARSPHAASGPRSKGRRRPCRGDAGRQGARNAHSEQTWAPALSTWEGQPLGGTSCRSPQRRPHHPPSPRCRTHHVGQLDELRRLLLAPPLHPPALGGGAIGGLRRGGGRGGRVVGRLRWYPHGRA